MTVYSKETNTQLLSANRAFSANCDLEQELKLLQQYYTTGGMARIGRGNIVRDMTRGHSCPAKKIYFI
jgi:hypothetical protein